MDLDLKMSLGIDFLKQNRKTPTNRNRLSSSAASEDESDEELIKEEPVKPPSSKEVIEMASRILLLPMTHAISLRIKGVTSSRYDTQASLIINQKFQSKQTSKGSYISTRLRK
ncbi:unnamed protein product [Lepeophtheirus salmonis]|uniref:(salmon louse) hypothetical protein n=1 Tax=Lepeophtheirus salmonis TaxID=72036 RepID=A0A7R8D6V4_LEPSM|nr:unnamed protein product [Lepeophtheirus salmonis]CAF3047457.1 unnamed protein product [Lepeophtheirus salmonis]